MKSVDTEKGLVSEIPIIVKMFITFQNKNNRPNRHSTNLSANLD